MEEISAAPGRLIELNNGKWSLFEVNGFLRQPLLEAQREGAVMFYRPDFGRKHGLPPGNWLTGDRVEQVVVGWAPDHRCWVLGIRLHEGDGVRWCELVRFPPSPRDSFRTQAQRAARALADVLDAPLRVIHDPVVTTPVAPPPPSVFERPPAPPRPVAEQPSLPAASIPYALPITLDSRVLKAIPSGLRLARTGGWVLNQVVQLVFYLAMAVVFGFISTRTLTTTYAPVQEMWLPFAGLFVMLALLVGAILLGARLVRSADVIFDRQRGALYYVLTMGRWLRPLRRQARAPMPLRAIKAVTARNMTPNRSRAEWLLFAQTADDVVMLAQTTEKLTEGRPPVAVQAAAAIASLLDVPVRVTEAEGR